MKQYLISIKSYMPYPVNRDYRITASGFGTAVSRAIKLFRKDKSKKQIKELTIKVTYAGKTQTLQPEVD